MKISGSGVLTAAFAAATFVAGSIAGGIIFDPFFEVLYMPEVHNLLNLNAQAAIAFVQDNFGFINEWIGLKGDGGFLNTDFMQAILAPYKAAVTPVPASLDEMFDSPL